MKINGQRGAFLQPATWGQNDQGAYYVMIVEGTKEEVLQATAQAAAAGAVYQVTESFGKSRLEARFPGNPFFGNGGGVEQPVNLWEFFANHAEKDLLDAKVESSIINALQEATRTMIYNAIHSPPDAGNPPDPTKTPSDDSFWVNIANATERSNAKKVYNLMKDGVRSFPVEVPMLRHTQTVSNRWAVKAALTNVRRIISTSSLISLEAIPGAVLFNLPTDTSSVSDKAYGWYKLFPTIQQVANQKFQIVQEWQYGLWATLLYGNPI
jgi:hypothetical protein